MLSRGLAAQSKGQPKRLPRPIPAPTVQPPVITIGTVTALSSNAPPTVQIVQNSSNYSLNFGIPTP